jgi:hypothetical protein
LLSIYNHAYTSYKKVALPFGSDSCTNWGVFRKNQIFCLA